jgi:hypothetical protein
MTSPQLSAAALPSAVRPRLKTVLWAGVASALAASIAVWVAGDVAFYSRFHLSSSDLPSWSPWLALELAAQAFAWCVMAGLWFGWGRRRLVVLTAVAALAIGGLGARTWAHHEAGRVSDGARVLPAAPLPFQFSAVPATMVPFGSDQLPEGTPAHVLVLRSHDDHAVVYDPATGETHWIGNKIAVPAYGPTAR